MKQIVYVSLFGGCFSNLEIILGEAVEKLNVPLSPTGKLTFKVAAKHLQKDYFSQLF